LQAGPRAFLVAGQRVESGALFTVELAVAADFVAQGCVRSRRGRRGGGCALSQDRT